MDPNANLKEQLELADRLQRQCDQGAVVDIDDVARLAELIIALDGWLSHGGFIPARWGKR